MKENTNIDDLFREKLLNYEQEPSAHILEKVLAGSAVNGRSRKLLFWSIVAVAAALLLAFVAGWQFSSRELTNSKQAVLISPDRGMKNETPTEIKSSVSESVMVAPATKSQKEKPVNSGSLGKADSGNPATIFAAGDEYQVIKPIESLHHPIQTQTSSRIKLREIKSENWTERSVDQQIMEQNQQMMLAQNVENGKVRWLIGALVTPVYNVSSGSQSQQYASNMLKTESSNPVDLGAGLTVECKPGKRWSLQSGVYYSGLAQATGNSISQGSKNSFAPNSGSNYLTTNVNVDATTKQISMNSPAGVIEFKGVPGQLVLGNNIESKTMTSVIFTTDAQFTQNFEYLEIPLYLRYTLLDTRFGVELMGGLSSNLLISNQTYMESSSGKVLIGTTKNMEPMNYSSTLGLGLKYELTKRFFLNLEPRVKYYLNSLNGNSDVTYKPYTIGVYTGLSYQF